MALFRYDAIPNVVARRVTKPDIPNAVGKNLEGDSWIIVPTWRGNTKGTRAGCVATELCPQVRDYLIAAHNSVEVGHRIVLEHIGLVPLLNLDLRLGEGTGAMMALHLVDDAIAIRDEMATFADAGVAEKEELSSS